MDQIQLLKINSWILYEIQEPDRKRYFLENKKTGFCDYPIFYDCKQTTAYEYPERIPDKVKAKISRALLQRYTELNLTKPLYKGSESLYLNFDIVKRAYRQELTWQAKGLQQTDSGYGSKLTTAYMLELVNGKKYRVYFACWSNAGTLYIIANKNKISILDTDLQVKLEQSKE